jgi:hypothetical protein
MESLLNLIVSWRLKFDLILITVSVSDAVNVTFVKPGGVRKELSLVDL